MFFSKEDIARIKPLFCVFNTFYNYEEFDKNKQINELEYISKQLEKPFDFEEKVLLRTKGDKYSIDVQKRYLRILMKNTIEEIKKEDKYHKIKNMI